MLQQLNHPRQLKRRWNDPKPARMIRPPPVQIVSKVAPTAWFSLTKRWRAAITTDSTWETQALSLKISMVTKICLHQREMFTCKPKTPTMMIWTTETREYPPIFHLSSKLMCLIMCAEPGPWPAEITKINLMEMALVWGEIRVCDMPPSRWWNLKRHP